MLNVALLYEGFAVASAADTTTVERYLAISAPKILLLDYLFPSAAKSAELVQSLKARASPIIILMTCLSNAASIAESLSIEYSIQKPFNPMTLIALIRKALIKHYPD